MEVLGIIIGVLHLLVGIIITAIRNIDDHLLTAKEKIQSELISAYKEFASVTLSESVAANAPGLLGLENACNRLVRVHYSSKYDVVRLKRIEWLCDKALVLIMSSMLLLVVSVSVGNLGIDESKTQTRLFFIIVIPLSLFFSELVFLYVFLRFEKYLKRLRSRYTNREY